jgi:Histidine kinase-, DNA gyrase B-, and HSP90-like ATPase
MYVCSSDPLVWPRNFPLKLSSLRRPQQWCAAECRRKLPLDFTHFTLGPPMQYTGPRPDAYWFAEFDSKTAAIRIERQSNAICVEVQDRGQGMSPERLAAIQSHGTGVGIRGMRERVRQFKGEMSIESDGSGTRIFVTFPLTASPAEQVPVQNTAV